MALSMWVHSSLNSTPLGVSCMQDLKPPLPAIKWIHRGMCEICEACTPMCIKYSGADPQLTLLALWATPIDAKLLSPAELLYWCQIRTTIPARILQHRPWQPYPDSWTNWCPLQCLQVTDRQMMQISLHPCMPASLLQCMTSPCKIWIPATVVRVLPKDSYQVHTSNGCGLLPHEMTPPWT